MIKQSDSLIRFVHILLEKYQGDFDCSDMAVVRTMVRIANEYIKRLPQEKQDMALQLAKSELEADLEKAGGLVETLTEVIKEQAATIELLKLNAEGRTIQ